MKSLDLKILIFFEVISCSFVNFVLTSSDHATDELMIEKSEQILLKASNRRAGKGNPDPDYMNTFNELRGSTIGASNMEYVDMNSELESVMITWVKNCDYSKPINSPIGFKFVAGFKSYSQLTQHPSSSLNTAFQEISKIQPRSNSSVYIQFAASDMQYIGCRTKYCGRLQMDKTHWTYRTNLMGCLYSYKSEQVFTSSVPYEIGPPCRECAVGLNWCYRNVCRADRTTLPIVSRSTRPSSKLTTPTAYPIDETWNATPIWVWVVISISLVVVTLISLLSIRFILRTRTNKVNQLRSREQTFPERTELPQTGTIPPSYEDSLYTLSPPLPPPPYNPYVHGMESATTGSPNDVIGPPPPAYSIENKVI